MTTSLLVLGLGASGRAVARYCAQRADRFSPIVAVDGADTPRLREVARSLEDEGVRVALGSSLPAGRFDLCVASPGIPPHADLMRSAQAACNEVISEIEFAYRESRSPWVAITGTNGKTTTTALVEHLLTSGGVSARAVGNIGTPAIEAVAEDDVDRVLVAEVSSFQLAFTARFHPRVAVLLNITPDHTDWHGSLDRYSEDKARVFANLGPHDVAVIDVDDPGSAPYADSVASRGVRVCRVSLTHLPAGGAGAPGGTLALASPAGAVDLLNADDLRIRGPHNVSNALAAAAAAHAMGVRVADIRRGLESFSPIEHRLEPVAQRCGAEWFNDSKATNPDAVFKAMAAFPDRSLVLLLGGRNKGNDFTPLAAEAARSARAVVLFGEAREELANAFSSIEPIGGGTGVEADPLQVVDAAGLKEAVSAAAALARDGDVVVLSPACASFDEFDDYEHRGRRFKELVRGIEVCGR